MSATITNWAVDLAGVGAIYPFVGSEMIWFILGVIFWIGFHIWQIVFENGKLESERAELIRGDNLEKQIKSTS